MIRTLNPGNKNGAYSILESTVAVFISSLLLLAVLGSVKGFVKSAATIHDYTVSSIDFNNQQVQEFIER